MPNRPVLTRNLTVTLLLSAVPLAGAVPLDKKAAPRRDYAGRAFRTDKAPRLRFERRLFPRLHGIDYAFAPQTARGGALFDRFAPFTLSDRRIHVSGPWYSEARANDFLSRGITSIEAMPNFRLDPSGPTDVRRLLRENKWMLLTDPVFYTYAQILADELTAANPQDVRIASLEILAKEHRMSPDQDAFLALGQRVWMGERGTTDARFQGVKYAMIDIETTAGWEYQRQCLGWLYQGMGEAAARENLEIVPVMYGQWQYAVGAVWNSKTQPDGLASEGLPEYLLPAKDPIPSEDPTLKAINEMNGVVSMDGYLQAIWGDEPFYQRDSKGRIVFKEGKPLFNDISQTTLYGQQVPLEPGEAQHCLQDLYRQATRMYLMHHNIAGAYPAHSGMAKPFLRNVRVGAWSRYTNEGVMGIQSNDRPLPPWQFETLIGLYLFTADDIVVWSSDFNHAPGPIGADYSKYWKYDAQGVAEYLVKAAHRYSELNPLHQGPFEWCWFHLPTVNQNETDAERFDQKPLAIGKIREFEGQPWLEFFASWPALDAHPATIQVWVEQNGKRSPAYSIQLSNGRSYFLDAWQLPANFKKLQGKDIWMRFTDQTGQTRTWRGDYRQPVENSLPTPGAFPVKSTK